jgi:predicted Zn-dependent protease
MMAGQQAALGKYLAFSRVQEATADAAGAQYLSKAGISGKGSLDFFKKLQNLEFRYAVKQDDDQAYSRTHPLSGDRIQALREVYVVDPAWDKPSDPQLEARFQRVKAKLLGYMEEPERTLRKYPESDKSVPARYARAYAWHKSAYPQKALDEVDALIATNPEDPYFLELEGQVLLESGRPKEAIPPLRKAVANSKSQDTTKPKPSTSSNVTTKPLKKKKCASCGSITKPGPTSIIQKSATAGTNTLKKQASDTVVSIKVGIPLPVNYYPVAKSHPSG